MNDPHMEKTVLGSMLSNRAAFDEGLNLEPADFSLDSHRRIFSRMVTMHVSGLAVDISTLISDFLRTNELGSIGGAGYLADLTSGIPREHNPKSYMRILKRETARRNILNLCAGATSRAELGDEPEDILSELSAAALQSQMAAGLVRPRPIRDCIVPVLEEMASQRKSERGVLGIAVGIPELDACTSGWRGGELTYVGALPGRGKTSFMLQAMHAAATSGVGVGCISLEMRGSQLVRRLAILHSGLHAGKFRDAREMNGAEYRHAEESILALAELPITITDQSGLNASQISSQAWQMHEGGAGIIFVDFVQIIREDGRDRREAITRVSASLRDTCKSLNIPFVVASQPARRDADLNRRPTLQDLRESGSLEQDAHNVLLLYRPVDKEGEWS